MHLLLQGANIFVDHEGTWWLGDFGSAVRAGHPITSTTEWFMPFKRSCDTEVNANPKFDW